MVFDNRYGYNHPLCCNRMDIAEFVKKDVVLVISAILALVSLFLVPFETVTSYEYSRILETICTLLFFLLIVAGLKECNALKKFAEKALQNTKTTTALFLSLLFLPFFCAMLFSNDVSLLTFVPLGITILSMANMRAMIPIIAILQTAAANIGSTLTPFGNPHNLYIFNLSDHYGFTLWEYESQLIPIVIAGTILLLAIVALLPKKPLEVQLEEEVKLEHKVSLGIITALFVLAILTVIDLVPFYITLIVIVVAFALMMPQVFKKVDYSILLVFFFLFVFANGMTNIESIHSLLADLMRENPMLTTVAVSQFTSNVPSTILLQPFTNDWAAVVVGADIGGFGTPIASMASIITLKLYLREEDSCLKGYLKLFLLINAVILAVLIPTYYLLH